MTNVLTTPEAVCNFTLAKIGYRQRIGSLYDGSTASKKCLDVYAQTRDALLRGGQFNFAQKQVAAVLAHRQAPYPYVATFTYPDDCLQVRSVKPVAYDANNPVPSLWVIGDDLVNGKVIWSYTPAATLVYTARVTDPNQWDALFVEAFIEALADALRKALGEAEAKQGAEADAKEAQMVMAEAVSTQG